MHLHMECWYSSSAVEQCCPFWLDVSGAKSCIASEIPRHIGLWNNSSSAYYLYLHALTPVHNACMNEVCIIYTHSCMHIIRTNVWKYYMNVCMNVCRPMHTCVYVGLHDHIASYENFTKAPTLPRARIIFNYFYQRLGWLFLSSP